MTKVLSINTYGGSLLLGASALGAKIVGSYEDTGYGIGIQKVNFPHLHFEYERKDWPQQDLSETIVISHPPCAAFSIQNSSSLKSVKGINSESFKCTRTVLEYAMENKALAIAVESVIGALGGAWDVHQYFAEKYKYNVYRILQNGASFSAQWRERFWVVFVRMDADIFRNMTWSLFPDYKRVKNVITGHEDGPSPGNIDELLADLKHKLATESLLSPEEMDWLFFNYPNHKHFDTSSLARVFHRKFFPYEDFWETTKLHLGTFASGLMQYVSPEGLCPTILSGSWFYTNGRNLSENAYKCLMGFPPNYIFPEHRSYRKQMRTYLSKGVIPQVATWVLQNIGDYLGIKWPNPLEKNYGKRPFILNCAPNEIIDFRFKKLHWIKAINGEKIPLRNEDIEDLDEYTI